MNFLSATNVKHRKVVVYTQSGHTFKGIITQQHPTEFFLSWEDENSDGIWINISLVEALEFQK